MCVHTQRPGRTSFRRARSRIPRVLSISTAAFMPFDLASVRAQLPGRHIDWFGSVNSTMILAATAARDGCASGTVIGADGQVAGIGRQGHVWHSEAEAGLYVSIVLRLPI